jgi:signal transduction histidine kinase
MRERRRPAMTGFFHSVTFRLALVCGVLIVGSVVLLSAIFYVGTVGSQLRGVDAKITAISERLGNTVPAHTLDDLARRIDEALIDGVDSDTEIYYLADARGRRLAGNIDGAGASGDEDGIVDRTVQRNGLTVPGRLALRRLDGGALLAVGRDMSDVNQIRAQVWRSIAAGSAFALAIAVLGSLLLRRLIERRILAIRHTAAQIEAGNLRQRIPPAEANDELARLGQDINRMLDRIEHLMDGVRHVSNTIAHNLRTPLGTIRNHLEQSLRGLPEASAPAETVQAAIRQIDDLIVVLEKLLQIAEAESGARRAPFARVSLAEAVTDIVEFYEAAAEERGIALRGAVEDEPAVLGDRHLIDGMLVNLLDNALKYAGAGAHAQVRAAAQPDGVLLEISVLALA